MCRMVSKIFFFKILKEHPKKPHNTDFQEKRVLYHAPAIYGQRLRFEMIEIAQKVLKLQKTQFFNHF